MTIFDAPAIYKKRTQYPNTKLLINTIIILTIIMGTTPVAKGAVLGARIYPLPEYLIIAIINYQSGPVSTSYAFNIRAPILI